MSKWTKHSDWQPIPKKLTKMMPICPICKLRTKWEIYDVHGWTERGYKAVCKQCSAEFESTVIDKKDSAKTLLVGPFFSGTVKKALQFPTENNIFILKILGNKPKHSAEELLNKQIHLSAWIQMAGAFCGDCGVSIQENEKFCPKCGAKQV